MLFYMCHRLLKKLVDVDKLKTKFIKRKKLWRCKNLFI